MSEAPQLPTPTPRHSRFAKSDDGVSSQRDLREKLLVNWCGAEDLQQPQPARSNTAACATEGRRMGSGEGTEHQTEEADADMGRTRATRCSDRDISPWLVRLLCHDR